MLEGPPISHIIEVAVFRPIAVTSARDRDIPWKEARAMIEDRNGAWPDVWSGDRPPHGTDGPPAAFSSADALLVKRCMDGEETACSELFHRYYDRLMPICMRYASDADDAKDILQEGFLRIFAKLGTFSGTGHFIGWLKRVMVNTAINHYRSSLRDRANTRYDHNAGPYAVVEDEETSPPYAEMGVNDILEEVQRLSPAYRMVFNLFVIEEWSHEQIATELGISVGTSKSNLNRARAQLKERLLSRGTKTTYYLRHGS